MMQRHLSLMLATDARDKSYTSVQRLPAGEDWVYYSSNSVLIVTVTQFCQLILVGGRWQN